MVRSVYQLVASGPSLTWSGIGRIRSKQIFTSRRRAEREIPAFTARAAENRGSLNDLASVDEVVIVEFELVEDEDDRGRFREPA